MASSTVENYLKAILKLADKVSVGNIADSLHVTPGTVTSMMKHLQDEGYVAYVPRKSVELLPKGRKEALKVIRRHRLLESFLVTVLHYDWSEVHEEAEILEHVISENLLKAIDKKLGFPTHDPHGDPIPDEEGNIPSSQSVALSKAKVDTYRFFRVSDESTELLNWLSAHNLKPNCEFSLIDHDKVANTVSIKTKNGNREIAISLEVAKRIFVISL